MNRFNSANGSPAAPVAPGAPANPYFTSGNPGGGVPATTPGAWWFHMMSEELRNAILAAGLTPDHTNLGQLAQAIGLLATSVPAGIILPFAGNTPPSGYLKANGAAVSTTTYAALTTAIYCGDANNATAAWGFKATTSVSPGSNRSTAGTFIVLPDLRGEFLRGWDDGRGIDSGRSLWAYQLDDFKSHQHTVGGSGHSTGAPPHLSYLGLSNGGQLTAATGGTETRPRNAAALHIIKF
jgi:phage-related tail fiber protein